MNNELAPGTQDAIDRLSYEIAMKKRLDFDGRKEIAGHIEDKVLGYLNAEETLTEEDALVLAGEHFDRSNGQPSLNGIASDFTPSVRTYAVRMIPFAAGMIVAGLLLDIIRVGGDLGTTYANFHEAFFWAVAASVGFVFWFAHALAPTTTKKANEWAEKKLICVSGFMLFLYSCTNIGAARDGLLNGTFAYTWPMANLADVRGLACWIAFLPGFCLLAYSFIRSSSNQFGVKQAACAMLFWFSWHFAAFSLHIVLYMAKNLMLGYGWSDAYASLNPPMMLWVPDLFFVAQIFFTVLLAFVAWIFTDWVRPAYRYTTLTLQPK